LEERLSCLLGLAGLENDDSRLLVPARFAASENEPTTKCRDAIRKS
jgi:hypothetical protein